MAVCTFGNIFSTPSLSSHLKNLSVILFSSFIIRPSTEPSFLSAWYPS